MLAATFGLLGVIVGGLITTGAQLFAERRRSRREARIAARMLSLELLATFARIDAWIEGGSKPYDLGVERLDAAWNESKTSLAELTWREWITVQMTVDKLLLVAGADGTHRPERAVAEKLRQSVESAIGALLPHGSELPMRKLDVSHLSEPWLET